jgi:hypothetical protein
MPQFNEKCVIYLQHTDQQVIGRQKVTLFVTPAGSVYREIHPHVK